MIRAMAAGEEVRAFAVTSAALTEEARKAHHMMPVATAALGKSMSAALMMAYMLKGDDDLLTIQIDGDGLLKGLIVTTDAHGGVKGYVKNPFVILPAKEDGHLDVCGGIGQGALTVNRDGSVRCAGGFILQLMSLAAEETIEKLEENLHKIPYVTDMLREGFSPEDMLQRKIPFVLKYCPIQRGFCIGI